MPSESSQFDLREVGQALWRRKWIVVVTVVVVTVAAYLIKQATTPQEYSAAAVVQVKAQQVDQSLTDNAAPVAGALAPVTRVIETTRFARIAAKHVDRPHSLHPVRILP